MGQYGASRLKERGEGVSETFIFSSTTTFFTNDYSYFIMASAR